MLSRPALPRAMISPAASGMTAREGEDRHGASAQSTAGPGGDALHSHTMRHSRHPDNAMISTVPIAKEVLGRSTDLRIALIPNDGMDCRVKAYFFV